VLQINVDDISAGSLQQLIDEGSSESSSLEFKMTLHGKDEDGRTELCKDICAMANASGGDILFGMAEAKGVAAKLVPLIEVPDVSRRRVAQALDTIEPRIAGVRVHSVETDVGNFLLVRVPQSFEGPHSFPGTDALAGKKYRRFVMRNGTDTSDLTMDQLRSAFGQTATLAQQASRFIKERLALIEHKGTVRRLVDGPIFVTHLVPLGGIAGRISVDLNTAFAKFQNYLLNHWGSSATRTFNLDGLICHPTKFDGDVFGGYTQIFRNGCIEIVFGAGCKIMDERKILAQEASRTLREAIHTCLQAAHRESYEGPAVVSCAVMHASGFGFDANSPYLSMRFADRPQLPLPPIWIANAQAETSLDTVAKPLLDTLWQAFGLSTCHMYNDHGNFT
jgi:hypothetical protein